MSSVEWTIYLADASDNRVAQVDIYTSAEFVMRFNDIGRWILHVPYSALDSTIVNRALRLHLTRDGVLIYSGKIRKIERRWDDNSDEYVLSGYDDVWYLSTRLALPDVNESFATNAYDVRTGAAETVMKNYVKYNLGSSAVSQRVAASITIEADAGLGSTVTGRARFVNLLSLVQSLARVGGGLGFSMTGLQFSVYQPSDLTGSIILSKDLGNLKSFNYWFRIPTANYVYCGGGGQGTARTFEHSGDSQSIVDDGRIELFADRRDTTDATELRQEISDRLVENAYSTGVKVKTIEIANMIPLVDYNLGDKVTVVMDDITIQDIVREIQILGSNGEYNVNPSIGNSGVVRQDDAIASLYSRIDGIGKRLSGLEGV